MILLSFFLIRSCIIIPLRSDLGFTSSTHLTTESTTVNHCILDQCVDVYDSFASYVVAVGTSDSETNQQKLKQPLPSPLTDHDDSHPADAELEDSIHNWFGLAPAKVKVNVDIEASEYHHCHMPQYNK